MEYGMWCGIRLSEWLYSIINAGLSCVTQRAMSGKWGEKWRTESINTWFFLSRQQCLFLFIVCTVTLHYHILFRFAFCILMRSYINKFSKEILFTLVIATFSNKIFFITKIILPHLSIQKKAKRWFKEFGLDGQRRMKNTVFYETSDENEWVLSSLVIRPTSVERSVSIDTKVYFYWLPCYRLCNVILVYKVNILNKYLLIIETARAQACDCKHDVYGFDSHLVEWNIKKNNFLALVTTQKHGGEIRHLTRITWIGWIYK